MEIIGKLKNGKWLCKLKKNEIAKLNGVDQDNQVIPTIEVGQNYSISSKWNLIKLLKSRKQKLKSMGTEISDISDSI